MADTIQITNALGVELISANPNVNSGLGKYMKGTAGQIFAGVDVAARFAQPLITAQPGSSGFNLSFEKEISLGSGAIDSLSISASATATVGVYNRTGLELFEDTFIGDPIKVLNAGQAFVAFAFAADVSAGVSPSTGNLTFGLEGGLDGEFRCYRPFDTLNGPAQTVGSAVKEVLENFVLPATLDDLTTMAALPVDTIAAVSGGRHLSLSASVNVGASFNPLASTGALPVLGKLSLDAGAKAGVKFGVKVSGDFQVRLRTIGAGKVRLSFHKKHGSELTFDASASAGLGVKVGDKDLLNMIFGAELGISTDSQENLVSAGISKKQLDAVKDAMKKGMSRKLSLEMAAQFSLLKVGEAAFEYELDCAAIGADQTTRDAVEAALAGDITALNGLEPTLPSHGVHLSKSLTRQMTTRKISLRINLLGIVNVLSITTLTKSGTVFHDEDSGEVTITDAATAKRISGTTVFRDLRKALYESTLMTVVYKASTPDQNPDFKASQSYFDFQKKCNRQQMSDFLDAVAAMGLPLPGAIPALLGDIDDFGKTGLGIETTYDQAACIRMFLDGVAPRPRRFYEQVGKLAVLALVEPSDPDSYRRIPMSDDTLWKAMQDAGAFSNFTAVLPPAIASGNDKVAKIEAVWRDLILITWWSNSMSAAANCLVDVQTAVRNHTPGTPLEKDKKFMDARKQLADALAGATARSKSNFDEPWGVIALFYASQRSGTATATLISPRLALDLP